MSSLEASDSIPVLFPESTAIQEKLEKFTRQVLVNHSLFRKPLSEDLQSLRDEVVAFLDYRGKQLMRGDDFGADFLPDDAAKWLFSEEHYHLAELGYMPRKSKAGRLGGVIAMHPKRDEIVKVVTPEVVKDWTGGILPPFLAHVSRLLTHAGAPACDNFAIEFLTNQEFWDKSPSSRDGDNAFTFWTYGPYVLANLHHLSLKFVLEDWAGRKEVAGDGNARYPGIEHLHDGLDTYYYLQKAGSDPSHWFVDFVAKHAIIPTLFDAPATLNPGTSAEELRRIRNDLWCCTMENGDESLDGKYGIRLLKSARDLPHNMDCSEFIFGEDRGMAPDVYGILNVAEKIDTPQPGALAYYWPDDGYGVRHVGIVTKNGTIISKWGVGAVFEHQALLFPLNAYPVEYYKVPPGTIDTGRLEKILGYTFL